MVPPLVLLLPFLALFPLVSALDLPVFLLIFSVKIMNKNYNVLFAGFGGQGVLFAGKVMAYSGLIDGMEVSWLPS